jgi:Flp pilus assembly protein TadG
MKDPPVGERRRRGRPGFRLPGHARGQSLVEFALTLPLLLVLLLFALDVGRLFYVYVGVQNAVREAAAYAAGSPACRAGGTSCSADPKILEIARQEAGGDLTLILSAVPSCTPSCTKSSGLNEYRVTVSLSRPFPLVPGVATIPGLGGAAFPTFTIGASATVVIQ